ncbi:YbjN domain-containing protein [Amphiplicatus metriothermophilus]|uniref:Sensory transduction regulator n=1 Tax=Amphiplicatus metriothermophilus TaxID=1519374 RepID=A0A239PX75_9PROT|nr:YbjN domain-containing protein [Amphiplicatus metriothermophilus]MBB5519995.1 hypothetical protein [Amphiplicatus metriothermophilus]SNT74894.1 hypothetical protein SAMN06297382_2485 [Amphiplicatus metriothermophilus]
MSIELLDAPVALADPLEALEIAADALGAEAERADRSELHLAVSGVWRDVGLWFTWRDEVSTLQMGAPLELRAPANRLLEASRLVTMVNERLWIGHFDLWSEDNNIVFRNAIVLPPSGALDAAQAQCLVRGAMEAIDRFYPAFNYFVWGGKSPDDALEASLFDTAGNA